MEEDALIIPILSIICAIGLPVIMIMVLGYSAIKGRRDERLAMINKGFMLEEPERKVNRYAALRNGMVMIGLAVGAVVGMFINSSMPGREYWYYLVIPVMMVFFGGLAFVIYFFFSSRAQEKEKGSGGE